MSICQLRAVPSQKATEPEREREGGARRERERETGGMKGCRLSERERETACGKRTDACCDFATFPEWDRHLGFVER